MLFLKKIIKNSFFICLSLFVLSFGAYTANLRYMGTTDTLINELYTQHFVTTGNLYLDEPFEYGQIRKIENLPETAPYTTEVDNKHYSKYPPATSVLAAPFFKAANMANFYNTRIIGKFTAAFLTALSIPLFYLLAKKLTRKRYAVIVSIIYGLASSTFGVSSQALWQHTTSQFISVIMLWLLIYAMQIELEDIHERKYFKKFNISASRLLTIIYPLIGVTLGTLIAIRTTNGLIALFIGLLILSTKNVKHIILTIVGGLIPLSLMLWFNLNAFGSVLASGYAEETKHGWITPFYFGFLGLLFSPSAGLLAFSPIYAFSFHGAFITVKTWLKKRIFGLNKETILICAFLIFVANIMLYAKWWAWYGNSWVYRMIVDTMPFITLAIIPALESTLFKNLVYKGIFIVFLIFSIYMQVLGAFSFDYTWEAQKLQTYKDRSIWFDFKNSHLVYLLANQKYYVRNPQRTVYVLGDKFGDSISFDENTMNISGDKKILHGAFINVGPDPEIKESRLIADKYAEGVSFFMTPNYQSCPVKLTVSFDLSKSQSNATFQVRELKDGGEINLTKHIIQKSVEVILENGAEEIRVQNDDTDDTFAIQSITLVCER